MTIVRCVEIPPSAEDSGFEPFDQFAGLDSESENSLYDSAAMYRQQRRIPAELLPFGENMFGDRFCIAVSGPNVGKVYYWDHGDERNEQDYWAEHGAGKPVPRDFLWGNIYLVAESFDDFLNRLERDPNSQ